jgi:prepilin-type N-terminal cleavage/methylation domain-containing protein
MRKQRANAFSLIEVVVVLAIIAALLTVLAVSFIRYLDRIAGEKETAALKTIGAAFKERVRITRSMPNDANWAPGVAAQLGWELSEVTANDRNHTRIFLIDPNMQVGQNSVGPLLPYTQLIGGSMVTNGVGTYVRPIFPRYMIVSTLGTALPSTLVSGVGDTSGANAFANLWTTAEGAVPTGWSWSSGADLKIQRIDLSDLFVAIGLANSDSTRVPSYGIDGLTAANVSYTVAPPPPKYFIRGSELKLYNHNGVLEYAEILYTSHDFTFELGAWAGKPYLGRSVGAPTGKDLQRAMDLFLKAPANQYAQAGATKQGVHDAMVAYMQAFIAWRDGAQPYDGEGCPGPVGNTATAQAVGTARATLTTVTDNLITPR